MSKVTTKKDWHIEKEVTESFLSPQLKREPPSAVEILTKWLELARNMLPKDELSKEITALKAYIEHGTYREAAAHLGMTKYALSERIYVLEGQVGQLLLRNERGERTPFLNEFAQGWLKRHE